jgi:NADPH-dependent 2,4-dienoyl-CoA reductase/sulfur reductase-like enzyme
LESQSEVEGSTPAASLMLDSGMDNARFVITGGGMVAGYAAKQLVELGLKPGELTILSADSALPYERPPLSKSFLSGKDTEDAIRISPAEFYREHGIDVRLGCEVTAVSPQRRTLGLSSGGELRFENLVIATGSRVRTLNIPGKHLGNVRYLRSLTDSKAIRERESSVKRAVVIGGGFIAMEVASVLAQKQIDTTMVLPEDRIWKRFFTPQMSQVFEAYFTARGVRFAKNVAVEAFLGDDVVTAAKLADGSVLPCELVVAGVGVRPAIEFLQGSGVEVDDGVTVNEYLETSAAGIFAAGDVANYPDLIFKKRRRAEHWDNAVSQGQHCGHMLMGGRKPFRHVPYFFSDVFDLSYEFWGDPADSDQVIYRGELTGSKFSVWWLRQRTLVAAFVMGRPDEEREAAPQWIESSQRVLADRLAAESTPIAAAKDPS